MATSRIVDSPPLVTQRPTDAYEVSNNGAGTSYETRAQMLSYIVAQNNSWAGVNQFLDSALFVGNQFSFSSAGTISAAALIGSLVTFNGSASGNYTLDTGANIDIALGNPAPSTRLPITFVNQQSVGTIIIAASAGMTLDGLGVAGTLELAPGSSVNLQLVKVGTGNYSMFGSSYGAGVPAYIQGTFVPAMTMGGSSTGFTYSAQDGNYTRIGNTVFIQIVLVQTAKGSGTGAVVITGLPYNASQPAHIPFTGNAANQGLYPYTLPGVVAPSSNILYIYTQIFPPTSQNFVAATNVDIASGNPSYMYWSGFYFTTDTP